MKKAKYVNFMGASVSKDGAEIVLHFGNVWSHMDSETNKSIPVNDIVAELQMSFKTFDTIVASLPEIRSAILEQINTSNTDKG